MDLLIFTVPAVSLIIILGYLYAKNPSFKTGGSFKQEMRRQKQARELEKKNQNANSNFDGKPGRSKN